MRLTQGKIQGASIRRDNDGYNIGYDVDLFIENTNAEIIIGDKLEMFSSNVYCNGKVINLVKYLKNNPELMSDFNVKDGITALESIFHI